MRLPHALVILLPILLGACTSHPRNPPEAGTATTSPRTLLEDRLLNVIEREKELDAIAQQENAETGQVQRLFHDVAAAYRDLLAKNPDSLETRLLYGKLLSRYGDRAGARDQFLLAARLDAEVAVIHQQLATFYAEEQDHTRALAFMLNAVEIEPQTPAYHFGLGQLLVAFRDKFIEDKVYSTDQLDAEMLEAFRTAARLAPNETALQFRYGEAFYDLNTPDWQTALNHWQTIQATLPLDPLQADALKIHLARCHIALHQPEQAQHLLNTVTHPSLLPNAKALLSLIPDS